MVTHFNTQRLVRMDLTPEGSTYKAVENEFLKLHNPDIHLTDAMEDPRDGSLLLFDTGGWFRIGCPSSLMAKSDILGAVYRITPEKASSLGLKKEKLPVRDLKSAISDLKSSDPQNRRKALEWLAETKQEDDSIGAEVNPLLLSLMNENLDAVTEHSLIAASRKTYPVSLNELKEAKGPIAIKHRLQCFTPDDVAAGNMALAITRAHLDSADVELARECLRYTLEHPDADEWISPDLADWLTDAKPSALRIKALSGFCAALISKPETQKLITSMLSHRSPDVRNAALVVIASQKGNTVNSDWLPPIKNMLGSPTPSLFDAIKKLTSPAFDPALQALAGDSKQPLATRLKALDSAQTIKLEGATFAMVKSVLTDTISSAASKIQAAGMLAHAPIPKEQMAEIAPLFASIGPVELKTLLPLLKKHKDPEIARTLAREIAKNPTIASQQESSYRTALADFPVDIFESIILPAYQTATASIEAKKRQLGPLADKAISSGNAARGAEHFKAGKGTCVACHKVGDTGRAIGPDLSKIGAIRTERDLLESILFPSNTLARDYEAHIIETSDGQQTLGLIKSHTAEGLLVIDIAGQEKNIPHPQIIGDTPLPTSLMPMGLDQTLPESELLDLVAWLRSLK